MDLFRQPEADISRPWRAAGIAAISATMMHAALTSSLSALQ